LDHLTFAAFRAVSDRSSGVSFSARAFPPFLAAKQTKFDGRGVLALV